MDRLDFFKILGLGALAPKVRAAEPDLVREVGRQSRLDDAPSLRVHDYRAGPRTEIDVEMNLLNMEQHEMLSWWMLNPGIRWVSIPTTGGFYLGGNCQLTSFDIHMRCGDIDKATLHLVANGHLMRLTGVPRVGLLENVSQVYITTTDINWDRVLAV